jgi:hypothetical protein
MRNHVVDWHHYGLLFSVKNEIANEEIEKIFMDVSKILMLPLCIVKPINIVDEGNHFAQIAYRTYLPIPNTWEDKSDYVQLDGGKFLKELEKVDFNEDIYHDYISKQSNEIQEIAQKIRFSLIEKAHIWKGLLLVNDCFVPNDRIQYITSGIYKKPKNQSLITEDVLAIYFSEENKISGIGLHHYGFEEISIDEIIQI